MIKMCRVEKMVRVESRLLREFQKSQLQFVSTDTKFSEIRNFTQITRELEKRWGLLQCIDGSTKIH